MNITNFFIAIFIGFIMIFTLFKPIDRKSEKFVDTPMFELTNFTIYEFNDKGLETLLKADKGSRFKDRYTMSNLNYADNTRSYISYITAKDAKYKGDDMHLYNNVVYIREDGLTFQSQDALYNKKSKIFKSDSDFVMFLNNDKITGTSLKYNTKKRKIKAKNVVMKYQLKE